MKFGAGFIAFAVRAVTSLLLRIDAKDLRRVPRTGPLIIVTNHVNFLDAPILISRLYPRKLASLAKKETWDSPFIGFLASCFDAIPVDRGNNDLGALRQAGQVLEDGHILIIAPEGTRHRDGVLGEGHKGAVSIAFHHEALILPISFTGLEDFGPSIRRLRRARVRVRVGEPFRLLAPPPGEAKTARREATEEIMRRIAQLVPEGKRGPYAGIDRPFLRTAAVEA